MSVGRAEIEDGLRALTRTLDTKQKQIIEESIQHGSTNELISYYEKILKGERLDG